MKGWPIATRPPPQPTVPPAVTQSCRPLDDNSGTSDRAEPRPPARRASSADLDPGQQRVRPHSPADRITVVQRLLAGQRGAVHGHSVPAQVGDPPLAVGEREPGVLPRHRGLRGKLELNVPPPGTGPGYPGFRDRAARS